MNCFRWRFDDERRGEAPAAEPVAGDPLVGRDLDHQRPRLGSEWAAAAGTHYAGIQIDVIHADLGDALGHG